MGEFKCNFVASIVSADGIAQLGARRSTVTLMYTYENGT